MRGAINAHMCMPCFCQDCVQSCLLNVTVASDSLFKACEDTCFKCPFDSKDKKKLQTGEESWFCVVGCVLPLVTELTSQDCEQILQKASTQDAKCKKECIADKRYKQCLKIEEELDNLCNQCEFAKVEKDKLEEGKG